MGPEQGRSRDLPYARVPDSLLLSHSSTATLSVPRIGSQAGSVMLPDSLRQPPSPATRAEAPDERQRTRVQHAPVFLPAGTTRWASCFAPRTSPATAVWALEDDADGPATASGSRRDLKLRRPATETRC